MGRFKNWLENNGLGLGDYGHHRYNELKFVSRSIEDFNHFTKKHLGKGVSEGIATLGPSEVQFVADGLLEGVEGIRKANKYLGILPDTDDKIRDKIQSGQAPIDHHKERERISSNPNSIPRSGLPTIDNTLYKPGYGYSMAQPSAHQVISRGSAVS